MFGFIKKVFVAATSFMGLITMSATTLKCILMNNQGCKVRPEIVNVNSDELVFFLLVLKQVNAVVFVTISMIYMRKCVFLMLSKA